MRRKPTGPHAVELTAPSGGDPGASSGCLSGVSSSLVAEIRRHPRGFYIQLHTSYFPNGALRGQL